MLESTTFPGTTEENLRRHLGGNPRSENKAFWLHAVLSWSWSGRGAEVAYYDPYVPVIKPTREHPQFAGKKSVEWDRATIENFDVVLIATNHSSVRYHELAEWAHCIVDTRNAMAGVSVAPGKVWKA